MVTDDRLDEYATAWSQGGLGFRMSTSLAPQWVGSWTRGAARRDSDIDIVVLTNDKARYLDDDDRVAMALAESAEIVSTQDWGPLTERRVRLTSGLEVEFGFVPPSWAATDPVDPGTAGIVRDGCKPLEDSPPVFKRLIARFADRFGRVPYRRLNGTAARQTCRMA